MSGVTNHTAQAARAVDACMNDPVIGAREERELLGQSWEISQFIIKGYLSHSATVSINEDDQKRTVTYFDETTGADKTDIFFTRHMEGFRDLEQKLQLRGDTIVTVFEPRRPSTAPATASHPFGRGCG